MTTAESFLIWNVQYIWTARSRKASGTIPYRTVAPFVRPDLASLLTSC